MENTMETTMTLLLGSLVGGVAKPCTLFRGGEFSSELPLADPFRVGHRLFFRVGGPRRDRSCELTRNYPSLK